MPQNKRSTDDFFTPFSIQPGGSIASPYGRGGSRRLTERGIFTPSHPLSRELSHRESLYLYVPKVRLLFLTSTAFVDTKAKPRTMRGEIAISIFQVVLSFLALDALFLQR